MDSISRQTSVTVTSGIISEINRRTTAAAIATKTTIIPDSKVHGANMGPIWGRQDPGGPQVSPMNFAIWDNKRNEI